MAQLLKRPEVELRNFEEKVPEIKELDKLAVLEAEARVKYSGYLVQQQKEFELREAMKTLELPEDFFDNIPVALSKEATMKILAVRPHNIDELAHIPGVRASDVALIIMMLKKKEQNINKSL